MKKAVGVTLLIVGFFMVAVGFIYRSNEKSVFLINLDLLGGVGNNVNWILIGGIITAIGIITLLIKKSA